MSESKSGRASRARLGSASGASGKAGGSGGKEILEKVPALLQASVTAMW